MVRLRVIERFAGARTSGNQQASMTRFSLVRMVCIACVLWARMSAQAQTFTSLHSFDALDGLNPLDGSLVQGTDGNFYGPASLGGTGGNGGNGGTVYKITSAGTLTVLYNFCTLSSCPDGNRPYGGLVLSTDGNFYGTTYFGGAHNEGEVYKITPGGTLTVVHSFTGALGGSSPLGGLLQATDGNFYWTTVVDGANEDGTVFRMTPAGKLTTLHSFNGADGSSATGLVQGSDGNFYGTTASGGAYGKGTVFKITGSGTLTTLYSFCASPPGCPDGDTPNGPLVQATDGNFYGTTTGGNSGSGTIFKITAGGTLTTLHTFNTTDGFRPAAGLVQATDRKFYGTTCSGGAFNYGTIFSITSGGTLTTLHSFMSSDGLGPEASLLQATNGTFYGTTFEGGTNSDGTVFSLSVGLGPFVSLTPASGKVGSTITVLGQGLTGTTSVSFSGIFASFTIGSDTYLTATVPSAATTGFVVVTTSGGTLKSNKKFRVTH